MEKYFLTVSADDIDKRLDVFICEKLKNITRSRIQRLIEEDSITVNGISEKSAYKVNNDDQIIIIVPEAKKITAEPQEIKLEIIYEDSDLIIVNKAKGMVTHPAEGSRDGTLVNAILFHCRDLSGIGGALRPGIVHRLDKDTTGLLVIAKNDFAHQSLSAQIQSKEAKRFYKAVVIGNLIEDDGEINFPIGRNKKDRKKMAVCSDGKNALTMWKVLERFGKYTLVELELKTGRTHQIRVHLSHIKHGILGDETYGPEIKLPLKLNGQALHAYKLGLRHPVSNKLMEFIAPEPKEFAELVKILRKAQR